MATTRKTTTKTSTTSTKAKSASMTAAAKSAVTKSSPATNTVPPVVVEAPQPVVAGPRMRKPELIDAVVAKTGLKKKDIKPAVEATLAVLGSALQDGRELNLEPLGKVKINREKKMASGKVMFVKIRQPRDLPSEIAKPDPKDVEDDASPSAAAE